MKKLLSLAVRGFQRFAGRDFRPPNGGVPLLGDSSRSLLGGKVIDIQADTVSDNPEINLFQKPHMQRSLFAQWSRRAGYDIHPDDFMPNRGAPDQVGFAVPVLCVTLDNPKDTLNMMFSMLLRSLDMANVRSYLTFSPLRLELFDIRFKPNHSWWSLVDAFSCRVSKGNGPVAPADIASGWKISAFGSLYAVIYGWVDYFKAIGSEAVSGHVLPAPIFPNIGMVKDGRRFVLRMTPDFSESGRRILFDLVPADCVYNPRELLADGSESGHPKYGIMVKRRCK